MAAVSCLDGSVLRIEPEPVLDRDGVPYEVTLRLLRDDLLLGEVGERCGWFLETTAARLRAARAGQGDEAFPETTLEVGLRAWAAVEQVPDATWAGLPRHLPRDQELFAFLARDPDDLAASGELRARLRTERTWVGGVAGSAGGSTTGDGAGGRGRWELSTRCLLEAWGAGGVGLRAVLTSAELLALLDALLAEAAAVGR